VLTSLYKKFRLAVKDWTFNSENFDFEILFSSLSSIQFKKDSLSSFPHSEGFPFILPTQRSIPLHPSHTAKDSPSSFPHSEGLEGSAAEVGLDLPGRKNEGCGVHPGRNPAVVGAHLIALDNGVNVRFRRVLRFLRHKHIFYEGWWPDIEEHSHQTKLD